MEILVQLYEMTKNVDKKREKKREVWIKIMLRWKLFLCRGAWYDIRKGVDVSWID